MTTQSYRNNQQANVGTPTAAGALVVIPTRPSSGGSGAGGGRVTGIRLAAVNTPAVFPGPQPGGFPTPPTGLNTPLGNPNFPCAAGPQLQGITSSLVSVDTGTGYYFRHQRNQNGRSDLRFTTELAPPVDLQQHMLAFDYYGASTSPDGADDAAIYVEPTRYTLPVNAVSLGGVNAAVWNPLTDAAGTGTALQAVQNAGGMVIRLDGANPGTGFVNFGFDASQLSSLIYNLTTGSQGSRITKVTLRYRAWRNTAADPAPGEGLSLYYNDNAYPVVGALNLYLASWLVTNYQNTASTVSKSLGETNYGARGYALEHNNGGATEAWHAHPYTIEDFVTFMGAGQVFLGFVPAQGAGANQRYLYLDYLELDVDVVPERRVSAAIRVVSNVYNIPTASPPQIFDSLYSRFSKGKYAPSSLALADLSPFPSNFFTLCVREALPIDPSDLLKIQPTLGLASLFESIGPSLQIPSITQYQQTQKPQLQTFTATVVNGQAKSQVLTPFENFNLSVGAFYPDVTTAGSFWAAYRGLAATPELQVWGASGPSYGNAQLQRVWVQGGVTYSSMHIIAQPGPLTPLPLSINLLDSTGAVTLSTSSITVAQANALTDRGAGWKSFNLALSSPFTPTVSGYVYLVAYSGTSEANCWLLSSSASLGNQPDFGYDIPGNSAFQEPGVNPTYENMIDRSMYLTCTMATPPAPTVAIASALNSGFACDVGVVQWVQLSWTPDATADKYAIEMSTDSGVTWMRMQIVETFGSTTPQVIQCLGAAWDISVLHRLVAYRELDRQRITGPASVSLTIASGGAVLGFSTATTAYVYSPVDPTAVELQWTDLNAVALVQLHGEPFNRALRENQDRGLRLTFQAVVDKLGGCAGIGLNVAQAALSADGFAIIQSLQREESLTVRFPGGNTRSMTMDLGGLVVRTSAGLYSTQIILTDVSTDGMTFTGDELFPVADI